MLERIEEIQGVGLFHDANGKRFKWERATLIYADNGRGKSTLTTLLRSVGIGDPRLVSDHATIDGTLPPKATLQFSHGHRVTFNTARWSELRPELRIFDSDFVESNVHSGGVVKSEHRKSLLQFAVGEKAVSARRDEESATEAAKKANAEVQKVIDQLSGHHLGVDLATFEKIDKVVDADEQIEHMHKRIRAAKNSDLILKRSVPANVAIPHLDIETLFTLLRTTLEDVQEDAETIVRSHIDALGSHAAEAWLSQGQSFAGGAVCPYCDQSTIGVDLITAYKTYFNAKYAELKDKLVAIEKSVVINTASSIVTSFNQGIATADAAAGAWSEQVTVPSITFRQAVVEQCLQALQELLRRLITQKRMNPTVSVGTEDEHEAARTLWFKITESLHFRQKLYSPRGWSLAGAYGGRGVALR